MTEDRLLFAAIIELNNVLKQTIIVPSPNETGSTTYPGSSSNPSIAALLSSVKWGVPAARAAEVSFSFPWTSYGPSVFGGDQPYSEESSAAYHFGFDAAQQAAARGALQTWANVANLRFSEVAESATMVGDIRFGWTSSGATSATGGTAWGWAYYPSAWAPNGGDIWLSSTSKGLTSTGWTAGDYNYEALIHEIGHAIGLKHPFGSGSVLADDKNSRLYSVMAYNDAPNSVFVKVTKHADGSASAQASVINPDTPMLYDIAAVQYMYGANTSYNAGNTTYSFDPATPFLRTIWDGGGNDTISVANFSEACIIDLQAGHFSTITIRSDSTAGYNWSSAPPVPTYDGAPNLAIAYDCIIENATGGSGADTLIGNDAANMFDAGAGNDTLYGGAGSDTAVFQCKAAEAGITWTAAQSLLAVSSPNGGTDWLSSIEFLQFSDLRVAVSQYISSLDSTAPTVTSFTPAFNAVRVSGAANIVLHFSEGIQRGSGTIRLWNSTTNTLVESFNVASSPNLSITGDTLTIDPGAVLKNGATYTVLFEPGTVRDMAGNPNAAIPAISFSTPAVEASFAKFHVTASNEVAEGQLTSFTVFLDSEITSPVTIYFSTAAGTASTGAGDYAGYSDRAITFIPGGPTSVVLTVETLLDDLAEGSENFRGVVYRNIGDFETATYLASSNYVTILDTASTDTTAPTVLSFTPQAGANGVATNADIVLNFSEAITRGSGSISIRDAAGHIVATIDAATSGMLTIAGSTLTINPVTDLQAGTAYTVVFSAGSLRDIAGNAYAGSSSLSFTTAAAPAPVSGTEGADNLTGSALNDVMRGLGGADTMRGGAGNDSIDGGSGSDTALYSGRLGMYSISRTTTGYTVHDKTGADGTDQLTGIETLRFADVTMDLQMPGKAALTAAPALARLVELYSAFFQRTPDADGMAHWIGQLAGGQSLTAIADSFYTAGVQYSSLTGYSNSMSDSAFINLVYKNALGRAEGADSGGMNFWSGQLASGAATRGSLVMSILDAAHGYKGDATYGWVADLLDNRVAVGKLLAVDLGIGYTDPNAAITSGMAISAAITAWSTSQALQLIGITPADYQMIVAA